jgi:hypothetical protein
MSRSPPVAIDDVVRGALADSAVDTTVCLFGAAVAVAADRRLERAVAAATDAVADAASGPVDVTVAAAEQTVEVRITDTGSDGGPAADDAALAYVRRLLDDHDGAVRRLDDGVALVLRRADADEDPPRDDDPGAATGPGGS